MASLIKNQILKHLSKFTKNLSPDKVRLSALKGEAELTNLILDEKVLTDVLELPSWIQLTKAVCNKVSIKIQWTKLKSTPIVINLDEVVVHMQTCEILREMSDSSDRPSYSSGGAYGFSDKVVDGMTVNVNAVTINFSSHSFNASAQLSRIRLDSRTPAWKRAHLQMTRLKDVDRGEVLIFKELSWQLLRIEAQALRNGVVDEEATPLRLITNQARCRITIKKKLIDCSVISSRLFVIMDDLLWVLTDTQLHQAFLFINSLSSLIKKSTELSQKVKGARKLENLPEYLAQANQMSLKTTTHLTTKSKVFCHYDVVETSYHIYSSRIDLHLCDEPKPEGRRPSLTELINGGALQIQLIHLSVDYYPYHLATGERKHWLRYNQSMTQRKLWTQQLMNTFHQRLMEVVTSSSQHSRAHTPLHRTAPYAKPDESASQQQTKTHDADSKVGGATYTNLCGQWKQTVQSHIKKLMSSSFIFRVDDLTIFKVSTGNTKQKPEPFLTKSDFVLPQDVSLIHVEHTLYYYPSDIDFPVPPPNLYINLSPLVFIIDMVTILWLNSFGLNLQQSKIFDDVDDGGNSNYLDIRIEALMPKVCIEGSKSYEDQPDRPSSLNLQASRVIVTNCRSSDISTRLQLSKCFDSLGYGSLFYNSNEFPSRQCDYLPVPEPFLQYALSHDDSGVSIVDFHDPAEYMNPTDQTMKSLFDKLTRDLLWTETRSVWSFHMDPFWAEFYTIGGSKKKPIPFIDAIPVVLWIYSGEGPKAEHDEFSSEQRSHHKLLKEYYIDRADDRLGFSQNSQCDSNHTVENEPSKRQPLADVYFIAHVTNLVSVQLDHYQFLFLMRAVDMFAKLTDYLIQDTFAIVGDVADLKSSLSLSAYVPQVELSLLLPADEQPSKKPCVSQDSSSIDLSLNNERSNGAVNKTDTGDVDNAIQTESSQVAQAVESASKSENSSHSNPTTCQSSVKKNFATSPSGSTNANRSPVSEVVVNVDSSFTLNTPPGGISGRTFLNDDTQSLQSFTDDVDSTSIRSDMSSDSEQYVLVDYENHPIDDILLSRSNASTPRIQDVEAANEIKEGETSSSAGEEQRSTSSGERRLDMFQVLTIKLKQVQLIQQSQAADSIVKVQCDNVELDQQSSPLTWYQFQDEFSAKGRIWKESSTHETENSATKQSSVKLRLDAGPTAAERFNDLAIRTVGHLSVLATNVDVDLKMTVVTRLLDLIEDEIIPETPVTPLKLKCENIKVHLDEDRPPVNVTSPGPIPLDMLIQECYINRDTRGRFHLVPDDGGNIFSSRPSHADGSLFSDSGNPVTLPASLTNKMSASSAETILSSFSETHSKTNISIVEELQEQNEKLTYKLISFTGLEEDNRQLSRELEELKVTAVGEPQHPSALENARMMMKLLEAQDEVKQLEAEKNSLYQTVQMLQAKLDACETQPS